MPTNILFFSDRRNIMFTARNMLFSSCLLVLLLGNSQAWGSDRIKLTDLKAITLYSGKMTNGRRSAPVPQLECAGGSAGCSAFIPQVVQCYNKGFDGYDVQWECKTDMDNAYRFGRMEVTCEGYDYPDDPYVLKGSCGLRYTLDLTKEGHQKKKQHNYGYSAYNYSREKSGLLSDVIVLVIVIIIFYAIIKTCLRRNQYSTIDDDYPQDDSRYFSGGFWSQASPPPPGFRTDHMHPGGCSRPAGSTSAGGGFWTGAMTGGLLGYMFGSRRNQEPYSSWGSSYRSNYTFGRNSSSSDDSSSGTRTASGFASTTRR